MVFSVFTTLLPAVSAFASTNTKKETVVVKKDTLNQIYNLNTVNSGIKTVIKTGSTPVDQAYVNDRLIKVKDKDEYKSIKDDEREALRNLHDTDMCDRHAGGFLSIGAANDPKFLEMLLFLVGDASGPKFDDITKNKLSDFNLQPEMVPSTAYSCFPDAWRTKYKTKEDWKNYQNSQGTASCGTFEVGCHVEKMLKDWLRKAIVMGMTWIIDIATGSGSGEAADVCRPNRLEGSADDEQSSEVKGFDASTASACSNYLEQYYASPSNSEHSNMQGKKMLASGTSMRAADPERGTGQISINDNSVKLFFGKSTQIGLMIALIMVIGAVIQGMVQSKPVIIFKVVFIYVPLFGLSLFLAPVLTKNFLQIIDGIAYYMADNSAQDIHNIAGAFGTAGASAALGAPGSAVSAAANANPALQVAAVAFAPAYPALMSEMMGKAMMFLGIVVLAFVFVTLALWALMMFREASILMVFAMLPIALSMTIWPVLAKVAQKFIKLLSSLIISKIPIVMALSLGINMLSVWVEDHKDEAGGLGEGSGGMRTFVLSIAIFMIALAAPTFVITLFDAIGDMAQTMGSKLHTGAVRGALTATSLKANMGQQIGAARNGTTPMGLRGTSKLGSGGGGAAGAGGAGTGGAGGGGTGTGGAGGGGTGGTGGGGAGGGGTGGAGGGQPGVGDPGTGNPAESDKPFRDNWSATTEDLDQRVDGKGRPAKQMRNGGFGQHLGNAIYGRALHNQRNVGSENTIGNRLRKGKNMAMGGVGAYIHRQGVINAVGVRQKMRYANPFSIGKKMYDGGKSVADATKKPTNP